MNVSIAPRTLVPLALATTLAFAGCSAQEDAPSGPPTAGPGDGAPAPDVTAPDVAAPHTTAPDEPPGPGVEVPELTEPNAFVPDRDEAPPTVRIERAAVIGASASAGFGLAKEVAGGADITDLFLAAAPDLFGELRDLSDEFFFQNPGGYLDDAVETLRSYDPDLIIGVDVQFWFGYGQKSMDLRVTHLEQCLAALKELADDVEAQVLIGDFPDVRDASFIFMPPIYEPDDATLAELNETVRAWCEAQERFDLVPMGAFVDRLKAGEPIELRGRSFDTSDQDVWLQQDRLHPTLFGTAALALLALDVLERSADLAARGVELGVEWEPSVVADTLRTPAEVGASDD